MYIVKNLRIVCVVFAIFSLASLGGEEPAGGIHIRRLRHAALCVGDSLAGDGGANGEGFWVQNGADEIEVTADGTVVAGVGWDEAGRCVGLYKDGHISGDVIAVVYRGKIELRRAGRLAG
jgi:hypothetical protein